jgi:hypothetical protein
LSESPIHKRADPLPVITREAFSCWLASASLLVNAALLILSIPVPLYYLKHKAMFPLDLPSFYPYLSPVISSVLFLAVVASFYMRGKRSSWGYVLSILVLAWALPEGYRYLAPCILLLATLYIYADRLGMLWRSLVMLASVISMFILSLSLLSLIIPDLKVFFLIAVGLNISPAALYPIITTMTFIMPLLFLAHLVIRRTPLPRGKLVGSGRSFPLLPLLLVLSISTAVSLIPHLPQVNPSWKLVGVDSPYYVQYAEAISSRTIGGSQVGPLYPLNTERSLTILLIYIVSLAVGTEPAVRMFPVLLSALFTTSSFVLARSLFRDERASILTAFFAATSFNLTAGYYAAILANWLSLSFAFLYFSLWVDEKLSLRRSAISLILLVLCWLSHAWTWDFVLLISAAYIAAMAILDGHPLRFLASKRYHLLPLVASFALDRLKVALVGTGGAVEAGTSVSMHYLGAEYLLSSFKNLVFSFQFYVGGFYSNLLVIALTLIGTYIVSQRVDGRKLLIMCWVSVLAVPFLIIDLELIWRILFMLPAPLICGYALSYSKSRILYTMAMLWQVNYVVYCLTALF